MDKDKKVYKANKYYGLPALFFPLLFVPAVLNAAVPLENRLIGFGAFVLFSLALAIIPLCGRLEVGTNYIKTFFLNFCTLYLRASDIEAMEYGNLFHGGLGFGKGLNIRAMINGKTKTTSLGENLYGKAAIADAKRALGRNGDKSAL